MTLSELKYIIAVAREKHFGRAAQSCFISQPSLSAAVKKLEAELGVEIFERTHNRISVTPAGEPIIEQAQKVLDESERIYDIAKRHDDPLSGVLKIGAIYTIGPYLFPKLIPQLKRRAPDLQLHIEEGYTHTLLQRLKQGMLDMVILSLPFQAAGVVTMPIYEEDFFVIMPKGHELTETEEVLPSSLATQDMLLLGAGNCFRDQILDICQDCQQNKTGQEAQTMEGGSLETIRNMVMAGVGVSVLPGSAIRSTDDELLDVRPMGHHAKRINALAWRDSYTRSEVIDVFQQAIHEAELDGCRSIA